MYQPAASQFPPLSPPKMKRIYDCNKKKGSYLASNVKKNKTRVHQICPFMYPLSCILVGKDFNFAANEGACLPICMYVSVWGNGRGKWDL